ncbi:MAG: hypothetical protein QOH73_1795 [Gaiellaceae bacterium]|jgi:hypothetical protein|nr:hypothetical protein [Gaiellaceae bacterium]
MVVALALYGLAMLALAHARVNNDAVEYYDFARRFAGASVPGVRAYQFGAGLYDAPFYVLGRLAQVVTGVETIGGVPLTEMAIALGAAVALVLTLYVGWLILRRFELPAGPGVLLLTVCGTPLVYYTALEPNYKHAVDTLAVTLVAYLMLRITDEAEPRLALLVALGAAFAFAVTVRYADVVMLPGVLLPLLLRRSFQQVRAVLSAVLLAGVLLFMLPVARGIPYKSFGTSQGAAAPPARVVELELFPGYERLCPPVPVHLNVVQCLRNRFDVQVDLRVPPKMLFSLQRGLFLWTPLTLFATLGVVLLFFSRRERRPYLWGLSFAAFCLVAVHLVWDIHWSGGFSFSQRFLTALFPFFLIGTAELVRRFGARAMVVLALCCAYSLLLALTIFFGYAHQTADDGLRTIAPLFTGGERTPWGVARTTIAHALGRFGL